MRTVKTVEHMGTVVEVTEDKAVVELKVGQVCESPIRCACCTSVDAGPRRLRVPRGELEQGDEVCVAVPAYAGYVSALVVFALPILMFVVGAAVGWAVGGQDAANDAPIIVGGLGGFALAVLVAVLVNRRLGAARALQVRRISSGGA
ncbi:MAG: hypothetical protein AMK73_06140 [Planctomycetes bacterium SM23_32]|nr:MAG: hypothetical protein AMK73_06140 [Planctomycetes bacterium SM23_32]